MEKARTHPRRMPGAGGTTDATGSGFCLLFALTTTESRRVLGKGGARPAADKFWCVLASDCRTWLILRAVTLAFGHGKLPMAFWADFNFSIDAASWLRAASVGADFPGGLEHGDAGEITADVPSTAVIARQTTTAWKTRPPPAIGPFEEILIF